jgi:ankyrin repeat protein
MNISLNQSITIFLFLGSLLQSCGPNRQLDNIIPNKLLTTTTSQNPTVLAANLGTQAAIQLTKTSSAKAYKTYDAMGNEAQLTADMTLHSFTIASGEQVSFFEENGIWSAKIQHPSMMGLQTNTTLSVICEQGKDVFLMLQSLLRKPANSPNQLIHMLQLREGKFIFLGSLGLPIAMEITEQPEILSLHEAVRQDNLHLVETLLKKHNNPNKLDHYGVPPLHYAVGQGNLSMVRLLLACGADPNMTNKDGDTPLHRAAMMTRHTMVLERGLEIIKLLLAQGADPDKVNRHSATPLNWAARMNGYLELEIVQLFLARGASVNLPDQEGYSLLHYVTYYNNHPEVIKLILHAADLTKADHDGDTALHKAAANGHLDSTQLLLQAGADINIPNKEGDTALHKAAENNHLGVMHVLLQAGANINAQNNDGDTALHIITAKNDPTLFVEVQQAITLANTSCLSSLQTCMIEVCPELSNNDSKAILLANIIGYAQQIDWSLKNNQGKAIQDFLEEAKQ